jgi:hypothetical protein
MFSGLNLAFFSISRLRLEAESAAGNKAAAEILRIREDANFLLTTILWGNVGINVLLTMLSNSVLAGVTAFAFSTIVITFVGEILPQAYFSRRAMRMAYMLAPVLRFYQRVLYPFAKPSALILDKWLGAETTDYLKERQLKGVIEQHILSGDAEIDYVEGRGALNFLDIDDVPISQEGELLDGSSVIALESKVDLPIIPEVESADNEFVRQVNASGKKWVVLTDQSGSPRLVLDSDAYLRDVLCHADRIDGYLHCHRPIVITDARRPLGHIIGDMRTGIEADSDSTIEKDIVLLWTDAEKRVITGADLLGRLLRGIDSAAAAS